MHLNGIDLSEYPALARPFRWKWGPTDASFEMLDKHPEDRLISNVRIVPFLAHKPSEMVVLKMADGNWDHPGGTREPDESFVETARRELLEEAGAKLVSLEPFGLIRCHSHSEKPFRPHMAHPDYFHIVVTAEVELVGPPENPPDEFEQTVEVDSVTLDEAVSRFLTREDGGAWMAEMYQLGARIRGIGAGHSVRNRQ